MDQPLDPVDRMRGSGILIRFQHIQPCHVFKVGLDEALGNVFHPLPVFSSTVKNFVVNIGEVLSIVDVVTPPQQIPPHCIPDNGRSRMSKMAVVINRNAAAIDLDAARLQRLKGFFMATERVVKRQHGGILGNGQRSPAT